MQLVDNMYYYMAYGLILITFLIVLKSPKKDRKNRNDPKEEQPKED